MSQARQLRLIEPDIPDRLSMVLSVAIVGLALGYLHFTEHGRQARARFEGLLDRIVSDLERLRETAHNIAAASLDELDAMERKIAEFSRLARR